MSAPHNRKLTTLAASTLCIALTVSACGAPEEESNLSDKEKDCATYEKYGDFKDKDASVSIYTPITDAEGEAYEDAWSYFAECTGIDIKYNGSNDFEAQIEVKVEGGKAPDIAFFPQPGLMERYKDKMVPASDKLSKAAEKGWSQDWLQYGTFDGDLYAQPMSANLKSLVWYSPKYFEKNKLEVPETMDELMELSDTIAGNDIKPWCAGIDSGDSTGWPVTDWVEDMLLREAGTEVYDKWVNHEIPFDDPQIVKALDKAGDILKNEDYMNGGYGSVESMTDISMEEGGQPILDNKCALHRQASFYAAQWPEGTKVGPEGDVFAFFLPGKTADEKPLLGGGEFVAAFDDSKETHAVREFLASDTFVNARLKTGPLAFSHSGADPKNSDNELNKMAIELFQDKDAEFRFDGSDLMPGHVGAKSFFEEMTKWIKGKSSKDALAAIEKSWDE